MKKIIIVAGLITAAAALSVTALAQTNWLLYLPAILAGSGGGTEPPPTTESNKWLLFLPAILAGSQGGQPTIPTETGLLNDTGITATTGITGEEDAAYGRDADSATNSDTDGHKGFSFTKLDSSGAALADQTQSYATNQWVCVQDNVTGLVWEVKTDTTTGETYDLAGATTYATTTFPGCGDAFTCRLPSIKELLSIVSLGSAGHIDQAYFPNTATTSTYLSGTEVANASSIDSTDVWGIDFYVGNTDSSILKASAYYRVRAVCTAVVE